MKFNNDFRHDLLVGRVGEEALANILSDKTVEVKRDAWAARTGNIAIEFRSRGKPSGIATSTADWWCFILSGEMRDKMMILIERSKLREICASEYRAGNVKRMGDNDTSEAVLVPFRKLLTYIERDVEYGKR